MPRGVVIGIIITVILLSSIGGYVLYAKNTRQTLPTKASEDTQIVQQSHFGESNTEYKDGSGFSFMYPSTFEISKDPNITDDTYAHLVLSSSSTPGTIDLKITDTTFTTGNEWITSEPEFSGGAKINQIQFGKLSGSELVYGSNYKAGAVDQKVLFTLNTDGNNDKLLTAYRTILKSFAFVTVVPDPATESTTPASSTASDSDVTFEGEEIVQ